MASVIGLGFVGSALQRSFCEKKITPFVGYDKYKEGGIGSLNECMDTPIIFICLPTPYDETQKCYGVEAICETMKLLEQGCYQGIIVIKSTVEPGTTSDLSRRHPSLAVLHNPEFLSAATAYEDFHNQEHIVVGRGVNCSDIHVNVLRDFYNKHYPSAEVSICAAIESESMKSFVNCFYAVKVQFFNEIFLLCNENGSNFNTVRHLMLKNKWINPMHTAVPGRDGKLSYGGMCFPKDTNALLQHMKRAGTPHAVLESCIKERNVMRGEASKNKEIDAISPVKSDCEDNSTDINGNSMKLVKTICGHKENGHSINDCLCQQ